MVKKWPRVKIGDILDFKNGLNKGKEFFGSGTPIVNYTDVYHKCGLKADDIKGTVTLTPDEIRRFEAKKNDVFFTRTSETPEEVGISSVLLDDIDSCVFSGFILRGRPKNGSLDPRYCKYCFSTKQIRREVIRNCTYTTRALTNGKVLSAIEMPLPDKDEQSAIATIIERFDIYIGNLTELIEKKRNIRDGALEDLVNSRFNLLGYKNHWINTSLGEIAVYRKGRSISEKKHYISTENMNQNFSGIMPYVGNDTVLGCEFMKSDVLLANIRPYLKKVWYACFSGSCSADVLVLQANETVCSKLLYYLVANERFINYIMAVGIKGIKMPRGDKKIIMKYPLQLPEDFQEQEAIASVLTSMDEEIEALKNERDKIIQIREGAMDDLLTGCVRLKV